MKKTMEYKGFTAEVRDTGPRLIGDQVFGLPQGAPVQVYYADEFINYPENWMKGQGVFVVPVLPEHGLWFNWRGNDELNTAIVPTVKGCNPITGLKTSGFFLEKYEEKCPKHGCDFIADRFCEKCGYKWPDRNYQSMHPLWWDGFRADDGTVRQFFISEDEMRDVATHMIGKKSTVPAFGFAFFTAKEKRQAPDPPSRTILTSYSPPGGYSGQVVSDSFVTKKLEDTGGTHLYHHSLNYLSENVGNSKGLSSRVHTLSFVAGNDSLTNSSTVGEVKGAVDGEVGAKLNFLNSAPKGATKSASRSKKISASPKPVSAVLKKNVIQEECMRCAEAPKPVKEVSIGAGAKIRQELNRDTYPLDSWKDAPDAVMTIYFVFPEKLEELKSKGMRNISSAKEGMLQNLPVG